MVKAIFRIGLARWTTWVTPSISLVDYYVGVHWQALRCGAQGLLALAFMYRKASRRLHPTHFRFWLVLAVSPFRIAQTSENRLARPLRPVHPDLNIPGTTDTTW